MPKHMFKLGAIPNTDHFDAKVGAIADKLAACRDEIAFFTADARRLNGPKAIEAARRRQQEADDEAVRTTGSASPDTSSHIAALELEQRTVASKLRTAEAAEPDLDDALFQAMVEQLPQAIIAADANLDAKADAHRQNIEKLILSRAELQRAENDRRMLDGLADAAHFEAGNPSGEHETSKPEFVYPVRPASRPAYLSPNGMFIRQRTVDETKIDAGLEVLREELEHATARREPVETPPATGDAERRFAKTDRKHFRSLHEQKRREQREQAQA